MKTSVNVGKLKALLLSIREGAEDAMEAGITESDPALSTETYEGDTPKNEAYPPVTRRTGPGTGADLMAQFRKDPQSAIGQEVDVLPGSGDERGGETVSGTVMAIGFDNGKLKMKLDTLEGPVVVRDIKSVTQSDGL